jgi:hypothetical protein
VCSFRVCYLKIKDENVFKYTVPVLYGQETLSLTLREERLRVFEAWVLRKIFGPRGDEEVT